jgi:hypothetical protein
MSDSTQASHRDPILAALLQERLAAPPLQAGFHEQLAARLDGVDMTRAGGRRRTRHLLLRIVPAAAAAAAVALFVFVVLPAIRGAATATAADVASAMSSAGSGVETVRLHVTESFSFGSGDAASGHRGGGEAKAVLTLDVRGDRLATREDVSTGSLDGDEWSQSWRSVVSYDQSRHTLRSVREWEEAGATSTSAYVVKPSWGVGGSTEQVGGVTYPTLAASVRALLSEVDPDTPVEETTYLGRPAWRTELEDSETLPLDDREFISQWEVTVDQATGLLLAASFEYGASGETVMAMTMEVAQIELDPELPDGWQRAPLPEEGDVPLIDEGTTYGTPEEVAERSWPTLPLVPQWAPAGYRLTDVASAGAAGASGYSVASWEWSLGDELPEVGRRGRFVLQRVEWNLDDQTVLVRFRRGFSEFTVEVSPKGLGESLPALDKIDDTDGASLGGSDAEDVTLTGGDLKGAPARTWVALDRYQGPRLLVYSERSRVWIRGDLTRQELIQVANSLKLFGDADRGIMPGY